MTVIRDLAAPVASLRGAMLLPAEVHHVRTVRRFTASLLARWGVADEDQASALLIVSELAANAAQHGRSAMAFGLSLADHILRIEVTDYGKSVQPSRTYFAKAADEHGRGLGIVDFLADWTETCQEQWGRHVRAAFGIAPTPSHVA